MRKNPRASLTLLLILTAILLIACMPEPADPVLVDPTGFVTYVHPTGVFTLSMPPDWVVSDTSDEYALNVSFSPPHAAEPVVSVYLLSASALGRVRSPESPLTGMENPSGVTTDIDGLISLFQSAFYANLGAGTYKELGRTLQPDLSVRIEFVIDRPEGPSPRNDFIQVIGPYFVALRTRLPGDSAQERTLDRVINTLSVNTTTGWTSVVDEESDDAPHDLVGFAGLNAWADSSGGFVIVGQVTNNAESPLEFIRITARLIDEEGVMIVEQDDFVSSDMLMPGEYAPFSIVFADGLPSGTVRYDLEASARYADYTAQTFYGPENFALSTEASFDEAGLLVVSGQVRNEGNLTASLVKVIVTIFDADQRVVGTDTTLVDVQQLAPGEISSYSVRFFELGGAPGTFLVTAQGVIAEN